MRVQFKSESIDNGAIYVVLEQLSPVLKKELDLEYHYRILDQEKASEKQKQMYEQIALPFIVESRNHHAYHHDMNMPRSWQGEQTCLAMIHALNQKARWLLYFYAVRETIEKYCDLSDAQMDEISRQITGRLIDDDVDIKTAFFEAFSRIPETNSDKEQTIINEVSEIIQKYEEAPSHPIIYR